MSISEEDVGPVSNEVFLLAEGLSLVHFSSPLDHACVLGLVLHLVAQRIFPCVQFFRSIHEGGYVNINKKYTDVD